MPSSSLLTPREHTSTPSIPSSDSIFFNIYSPIGERQMLPWHTNIILNSIFPYSKAVISHVLPQYANSITITNKADYSHFGKILQIVASHVRQPYINRIHLEEKLYEGVTLKSMHPPLKWVQTFQRYGAENDRETPRISPGSIKQL